MRLLLAAATSLALSALAGCTTDAPPCRYWSDAPIGRGVLDPSAMPMLPYNPYWVVKDGSTPSAQVANADTCAGEPGHLAFVK
ncbi:MAG TPA: hypothetical protein VF930_00610 [Stellaceae bacterium]